MLWADIIENYLLKNAYWRKMMRDQNRNRRNKRSRGQGLVEFALLLPLLLVIVVTTIELGRLLFTQIVITNASREGAYYMSTNASLEGKWIPGTDPKQYYSAGTIITWAEAAVNAEAQNSGIGAVTVSVSPASSWEDGTIVTVTVNTVVEDLFILGFAGNAFSPSVRHAGGFSLSASTGMMIQP